MVQTHQDDPLWRNVGLILSQYKGLVSGYDYVAPKNMVSRRLVDCSDSSGVWISQIPAFNHILYEKSPLN